MSRAVILPYPGDPFLLNYWLHLFDTIWGSEVDKLYIYLNSPIEKAVVDYIRDLCLKNPKNNFQYVPNQTDHGPAIDRTLDIVTEDLIMLVEDDGFIFKPGMVDFCFKKIESGDYDIVGSKRGSCNMEILTAAQAKWGLMYEGEGDQGPNFWPNFFFISKELLLKTDRNFSGKAWYKGEVVEGLGHTVIQEIIHGDTFVNTSLQLRGIVPIERIFIVPQYHGHPDDLDHAKRGKYLFDGQAPWTHIGSLSSGVGGVLRDDQNRQLTRRLIDPPAGTTRLPKEWCQTEAEKQEWERRVQWWLTFIERVEGKVEITEFANLYYNAVMQIIEQYNLSMSNIRQRQKIYKNILGI